MHESDFMGCPNQRMVVWIVTWKSSAGREVHLVAANLIRPHEKTTRQHVDLIAHALLSDEIVREPLLVGRKTYVLLDGHHRFAALKNLGFIQVPVCFLDEATEIKDVVGRRPEIAISHSIVVEMAERGELFPPKTSRYFPVPSIGSIDFPLAGLMAPEH